MSNEKKASPELLEEVKTVLEEAAKHTYSISRVFNAYNKAFGLSEKHQGCASCLKLRVQKLDAWYKENTEESPEPILVRVTDGEPFLFTPGEEPDKGTVRYENGKAVKAGTYTSEDGKTVSVQPGGKATIKEEDLT